MKQVNEGRDPILVAKRKQQIFNVYNKFEALYNVLMIYLLKTYLKLELNVRRVHDVTTEPWLTAY